MVSQITLGNISTQNGRNVISGSQSGLDTEGLIKALTEAKRLPATQLETKNKTIATKKTALTSLQSLLTRFKTAVDTLRNPPGVQNASQNIFEYRTASFSSVVTPENYISATIEPGTAIQNFTINQVTQLAQETKEETGTFLLPDTTTAAAVGATPTSDRFTAGTFSLRVLDGGADANITLEDGDSLQDVVSKFNAVKDRTGIQATVLKVATGSPNNSYKIVFSGTATGTTGAFEFDAVPGPGQTVTSDPDGVLGQLTYTPRQTAQNAIFKLDGVSIQRESNTVDDLIEGVTLTLKQPLDVATPITMKIEPDTEIVTNALNAFADVYNEMRVFAAKQMEVGDDGLPTEDAVLANDNTLRSVITQVADQMNVVVAGLTNGDPERLADIGINFQNFEGDDDNPATKNIIVIDAQKLQSALQSNFDGVRGIFEYQMTSENSNLATFKRTNALNVNDFTLNLDVTNNVYTATYSGGTIQLDYEPLSGGGVTLKGQAGTVLEGLELVYGSTQDDSFDVHVSQGIGDKLFNVLDALLAADGGMLPTSLTALTDQTKRNTDEITKIDDYIVTYRDQLIDKYSKLESALTKANQLLSLLDAQANARNNA